MEDHPTSGLTDRQLKFSYWYISHKLTLKKELVVFLILLSVVLWLFVAWSLASYFLNYKEVKQLENYLLFTSDPSLSKIESQIPQNINVSDVMIFSTENGYDYQTTVSNSNKDWLAEFDYKFIGNNDLDSYKKGFVLPGSINNIMDFSKESDQPKLQIINLKWRKIVNFEATKNKMDYFVIENDKLEIGQDKNPSVLSFEIKNNSPYSYWNVDVQILLSNGGTLSGVNHTILNEFKSGEKRNVSLLWNHSLPSGSIYEIIPTTNYLDTNNVMPVSQN